MPPNRKKMNFLKKKKAQLLAAKETFKWITHKKLTKRCIAYDVTTKHVIMLNIFIGNYSEIYQLFSVSRFFLNDLKKNNKTTFFLQPIIKDQSSWRKKGYICFSDTLTLNKAVSNIGCSIHTVELLFFAGGLFSRISRVFENPR